MKCFIHRNADSIAICRSCGRALCPDCVAEVGLSCACKNRCESDVARFNAMITRGAEAQAKMQAAIPRGYDRVAYLMLMGAGLIGFGVYNFGARGANWFLVAMGVLMFLFGISQFFVAKKFRKKMRGTNA